MKRLDTRASDLPRAGASIADHLGGMFDLMPDFKALLDSGHGNRIEANAARFAGLYCCGQLRSDQAPSIASGSIRVTR